MGLEKMLRHPGSSDSRKLLALLHLEGEGEEWCSHSPLPAGAVALEKQSLPDPWLSRETVGE